MSDKFRLGDSEYDGQEAYIESGRRCDAHEPTAYAHMRIGEILGSFRAANRAIADAGPTPVVIPVHAHIIRSSVGAGDVSDARMDDQIDFMNQQFSSHSISFDLASVDRHDNNTWFNVGHGSAAERDMKGQLHQNTRTALNFYTAELLHGLLGWATFPWDLDGDPIMDGVVMHHATLPGGSLSPFNLGATAVHEVGHWLGLWHTFQGGCFGPGDEVADTPPQASPSSGCPVGRNSCSNDPRPDPIHNFMDYSDDACMNEFTSGQQQRMHEMVHTFRPDLVAATAAAAAARVARVNTIL